MSNVLSKYKQEQVVALGRLGWSLRRIEQQTGVRRETASSYLRAAGLEIRAAGRWGRGVGPPKPANEMITDPASAAQSKPAIDVITDCGDAKSARCGPVSACVPYHDKIVEALGLGRNAMSIWQDLVSEDRFPARYSSVMRYVAHLRHTGPPEACVTICTAPGQEAQVDYGDGPMVRDPQTGKYRRTRLFAFTLGFSRKSVRILTWRSSSRIWAELHEQAFRRLGGAPHSIVLDNLREGVLRPDIYDPEFNPLYADVLKHYGAVAIACRVRDPDRKGKVESAVGHAQRTPLKGRRFESIEEAQHYLDNWEDRWADTRIHGTTKRQVAAMFAEEWSTLTPLPIEPFRYYEYGTRTVHLDGCIEVGRAYYSAPPGMIGTEVPVQWDGQHVRILDPVTRKLLREHRAAEPGRRRMSEADKPSRTPKTTEQLLARAAFAGRSIGRLCREIHRVDGEPGVRRILGVLSLTKKAGPTTVDSACTAALELGVPTYRFVRRYIERQLGPPLTLRQVDPLIRELTQYKQLIENMTKETPI